MNARAGWHVTLSEGTKTLRTCRFQNDHTLEAMIRKGKGLTCLEDKQSVERGMQQGLGTVTRTLDGEQYAALLQPL